MAHYHGVDLAPPALEIAARNLEALDCPIELEHGDFIEAIYKRPEPADVVWIGLSLHHLDADGKRDLMRAIRDMIGPDGLFLSMSRPASAARTGRDSSTATNASREASSPRWRPTSSTPSSATSAGRTTRRLESWATLGCEAGFAKTELVFTGSPDLLRTFCFSG